MSLFKCRTWLVMFLNWAHQCSDTATIKQSSGEGRLDVKDWTKGKSPRLFRIDSVRFDMLYKPHVGLFRYSEHVLQESHRVLTFADDCRCFFAHCSPRLAGGFCGIATSTWFHQRCISPNAPVECDCIRHNCSCEQFLCGACASCFDVVITACTC